MLDQLWDSVLLRTFDAMSGSSDGQAVPEALVRMRSSKRGYDGQTEVGRTVKNEAADEGDDDDDSNDNSDREISKDFDDDVSEASSNDGFDDDLAMLEGYSFVSVTTDVSIFEMHGLVQLATRKWLESKGQLERWKEQYIDHLCAVFPPGRYENWTVCGAFFPHPKSAAALKPQGGETLLRWATVMYNAAWYASTKGSAGDTEVMSMRSLEARAKRLGESDVKTLRSMAMVALAKNAAGKWEEAEELHVQVLEIRKEVLGSEHPYTLTSLANLASTYGNQGRWEEAEKLEMKVLETSKQVLGVEHPNTLTGMANLAHMLKAQGHHQSALALLKDCALLSSRVLSSERQPSHFSSLRNQPPRPLGHLSTKTSNAGPTSSTMSTSAPISSRQSLTRPQQPVQKWLYRRPSSMAAASQDNHLHSDTATDIIRQAKMW